MHRLLDHADFVLVASAFLAIFTASVVAASLGIDSRGVAFYTLVAVGVVHGGLHLLVQRLRRDATGRPTE